MSKASAFPPQPKNIRTEIEKSFDLCVDDNGDILLILSVWGKALPEKGFLHVAQNRDEAILWRTPKLAVRLVNIPPQAMAKLRNVPQVLIAEMEQETRQHLYRLDVVVSEWPSDSD
jgi:hypothetical protein